jgi:hypothetical protein
MQRVPKKTKYEDIKEKETLETERDREKTEK